MLETNKPKADKKQITLSFKTKDARELELFEFFSQAMGRQALMKSILWEYYQRAKRDGTEIIMPPITNVTSSSASPTQADSQEPSPPKKRRNIPKSSSLLAG